MNSKYIRNIYNNEKYLKNDKSFFYHLKDIEFELFITLHYKQSIHYKNTQDGQCNRRRLLKELFLNITRYLEIPQRSLMYFGVSELGSDNKIHSHILLKLRKDVNIEYNELIDAFFAVLDRNYIRIDNWGMSRIIEVVQDSMDAANYILKLKNSKEKKISVKEEYYHSKNFEQICESCKNEEW
jgi:hypothetical protein